MNCPMLRKVNSTHISFPTNEALLTSLPLFCGPPVEIYSAIVTLFILFFSKKPTKTYNGQHSMRSLMYINTSFIYISGYRDAQCGFLQIQEDRIRRSRRHKGIDSLPPRQGLFVVIYAPKKGLVEIFSTQTGLRVTSFKVSKFGRLIYNPRGYLAPASSGGFNLSHNQVIFITEEGLTEFLVPFHCALALVFGLFLEFFFSYTPNTRAN